MLSRLTNGVEGLNQNEDLGGIEGMDAVAGCGSARALALIAEPARECVRACVWCVEKEKAEMLSQRELAREVIQDEPSLSMLISSVAKLGRRRSSTGASLAGGQGSRISSSAARFFLMMMRVPTRQLKAAVLRTAVVVEYATSPMKKLRTLVAASTPAIAVEVATRSKVGAQSIQCLLPKATERPIRTCKRVNPEMTRRQVWRRLIANQSLTADPGSPAIA